MVKSSSPAQQKSDGFLAGMTDASGLLDRDVTRLMESFARLQTDEQRSGFAGGWVRQMAARLDETWTMLYPLLALIRDRELYRDPRCMGLPRDADRRYESFADYFEAVMGQPFATWNELEATYRFAHTYAPELKSLPYSKARVELLPHGGDRKSEQFQENQPSDRSLKYGETTDYLRARLARDYPEFHARLAAGEFKSVNAASRAAGIVKDKLQVVREPAAVVRAVRKNFTPAQIREIIAGLCGEEDQT